MRIVKVINETRGTVVATTAEVAETSFTRMKGLLGRDGLDAGRGLWIKPSSGVHTIAMKFPIDVIGLDKDRRVIKLWQNLVPYRITSVHSKLRSVVELPAGCIAQCSVQVGDLLHMDESVTN
jgi:uncharacterized membrane protein (UPF0127 family)